MEHGGKVVSRAIKMKPPSIGAPASAHASRIRRRFTHLSAQGKRSDGGSMSFLKPGWVLTCKPAKELVEIGNTFDPDCKSSFRNAPTPAYVQKRYQENLPSAARRSGNRQNIQQRRCPNSVRNCWGWNGGSAGFDHRGGGRRAYRINITTPVFVTSPQKVWALIE